MDKPRPIEAYWLLAYPEHASVMLPDQGEPEKVFRWHKLKPDAKTGRTVTPLWGVLGPHGCAVTLYADGVFTVTGLWSGSVTKDSAWLRALDKEFSQLLFDWRAPRDMDRRVTKAVFQSWLCKNT